jgi:hypothetical protein
LRWRGIEATLSLSESENSKVVIIGNNATGLPLILDTRSNDTPHVSPSSPTTSVNAPKAQSQKRASTSDPLLTTRKTQAQDKVNKDQ